MASIQGNGPPLPVMCHLERRLPNRPSACLKELLRCDPTTGFSGVPLFHTSFREVIKDGDIFRRSKSTSYLSIAVLSASETNTIPDRFVMAKCTQDEDGEDHWIKRIFPLSSLTMSVVSMETEVICVDFHNGSPLYLSLNIDESIKTGVFCAWAEMIKLLSSKYYKDSADMEKNIVEKTDSESHNISTDNETVYDILASHLEPNKLENENSEKAALSGDSTQDNLDSLQEKNSKKQRGDKKKTVGNFFKDMFGKSKKTSEDVNEENKETTKPAKQLKAKKKRFMRGKKKTTIKDKTKPAGFNDPPLEQKDTSKQMMEDKKKLTDDKLTPEKKESSKKLPKNKKTLPDGQVKKKKNRLIKGFRVKKSTKIKSKSSSKFKSSTKKPKNKKA